MAVTTRNDTNEVLSERALETSERQGLLKLGEANDVAESILDAAKQPEQPAADQPPDNVIEMVSKACTATTLAGLCTVHGSECPNPETIAEREAKAKE